MCKRRNMTLYETVLLARSWRYPDEAQIHSRWFSRFSETPEAFWQKRCLAERYYDKSLLAKSGCSGCSVTHQCRLSSQMKAISSITSVPHWAENESSHVVTSAIKYLCITFAKSVSRSRRSAICDTRSRSLHQTLPVSQSIWYKFFSGTSFLQKFVNL